MEHKLMPVKMTDTSNGEASRRATIYMEFHLIVSLDHAHKHGPQLEWSRTRESHCGRKVKLLPRIIVIYPTHRKRYQIRPRQSSVIENTCVRKKQSNTQIQHKGLTEERLNALA